MHEPSLAPLGPLALVLTLAACPGDDTGLVDTTGEDSTTGPTTGNTVTPPTSITITGQDTGTTTDDPTTTGVDTTTGPDPDTGTGTTTTDPDTGTGTDSSTGAESTSTGDESTSTGALCMAPEEDCGGMCVDTTMSAMHCGMCDQACMMGDTCAMSLCNGVRELMSNGDFAAGTTDWTAQNNPDQVLSCMGIPDDEMIVYTDGGGFMTLPGSMGPSSHVFYQDFVVPMGVTAATFSMDYALELLGGLMLDPANVQTIVKDCLDENMDGFEQNAFRIDIVDPALDVFVAPILYEVGTPDATIGDPYIPMLVNLSNVDASLLTFLQGQEGNTLRLRIAHVESTFPFIASFDNVSMVVNVTY